MVLPRPPPKASRLRWIGSNSAVSLAPSPRLSARRVPRSSIARAVCSPSSPVTPKVPRNCDVPSMNPRGIAFRVPVARCPRVGAGATRPSLWRKARSRLMRSRFSSSFSLRLRANSSSVGERPSISNGVFATSSMRPMVDASYSATSRCRAANLARAAFSSASSSVRRLVTSGVALGLAFLERANASAMAIALRCSRVNSAIRYPSLKKCALLSSHILPRLF